MDEQLTQMREAIAGLRDETDTIRRIARSETLRLDCRLDELQEAHGVLESRVADYQEAARELNGRGFPLAAVGALFASVPFAFVSLWWTPMFLIVLSWAGYSLHQGRREVRSGWRNA